MQKKADNIPHEFRERILLEWLPQVKISHADFAFKMLWEAYYIYIDPDGIPQPNCNICMNNVIKNWRKMQPYLIEAERKYNLLKSLNEL